MHPLRSSCAAIALLAAVVAASCGNSGDGKNPTGQPGGGGGAAGAAGIGPGFGGAAGSSGGGGIAGIAGESGMAGGAGIAGGGVAGGAGIAGGGIAGSAGTAGTAGTAGSAGAAGSSGAAGAAGSMPTDSGSPIVCPTCGTGSRVTINMGETPWKFSKTDPADGMSVTLADTSWADVGVPHTWNDVDTFINQQSGGGDGSMAGGLAWYRKHFTVDNKYADRKIFVEFGGAHTGAQVYINGTFIKGNSALNPQATHVIGFVPFAVDITPYVKFGTADNVLAVRVGNGSFYQSPGFAGVFRFGQNDLGLFRPVWMHITDKVHVPLNVYSVLNNWGTAVATKTATDASATVEFWTNVQNEGAAAQNVTVSTRVFDSASVEIAKFDAPAQSVAPGTTVKFVHTGTIANPKLWYPNASLFGRPNLYRVFHVVSVGATVVDVFESPLGIRTITWEASDPARRAAGAKDFPFINGRPHFLWGASGRYDYPALGTALPEEQHWRDVKLTADAGGRLWRPGHSSSSLEFVDVCDAYGVMLIQPSGEGEGSFSDASITDYKKTLKTEIHRDMVIRDRNHPSILAWEISNGPIEMAFAQAVQAAVRTEWDPIMPRAQAARTRDPRNGELLACTLTACEVGIKNNTTLIDGIPVGYNPAWGAEAWGKHSARFAYDYELAFAGEFINNWRKSKEVSAFGIAHWYLAETPGEAGNFEEGLVGAQVRSFGSSMMDFSRIPKLLYHIYRAAWTPFEFKPVVALAHHWNRQGNVRVNAFSNCPKVDLKINGASQGQKVPNPWQGVGNVAIDQNSTSLPFQVSWDVTWAAGTLLAECLDAGGKVVATDQKVTAGTPAKILLTVEPPIVKPSTGEIFKVKANGSDAAFVLATVVDDKGVWVPTASNPITFGVAGPANYRGGADQYVTAGKPLTYHAPGDPELAAEGGMCKVAIRSKFQAGEVTVTATSPGLAQGEAKFTVYPLGP